MSNPVQKDNVDRAFSTFDLDGDGEVKWSDFEVVTHSIGREFGLDEDAPETRGLLASYRQVWDYIRGAADTDEDGSVSKAEFEAAHLSGRLSLDELLDLWEIASDRSFEMIDRDGDGYIDADGLATLYRGAGMPDAEQVAVTAFAGMDTDGNGRVDKAELAANVRGVFAATDESMKGANMLGEH